MKFSFEDQNIRVVTIDDESWFAAVDVCRILFDAGKVARRGSHSYTKVCAEDEKRALDRNQMIAHGLIGGNERGYTSMTLVSEAGLYRLVMKSRKPCARPFQDWVVREVLPSIRKTGSYELPVGQEMPLPAALNEAFAFHLKGLLDALTGQQEILQKHTEDALEKFKEELEARYAGQLKALEDQLKGWYPVYLRTVMVDGEPWFVAADVTRDLGYKKGQSAVALHVKDHQKSTALIRRGGAPNTIISEGGLNRLIMRSQLPEAEDYQDFITDKVMPSLRKHGGYIIGQDNPEVSDDDLMARAFMVAKSRLDETARKLAEKEFELGIKDTQIETMRPYVNVAKAVVSHQRTLYEFCRTLPGCKAGSVKEALDAMGHLYKSGDGNPNIPSRKFHV